ncbi:protein of unknown function [Candidatus Methylomirabilis oxygeniifera]|uniref:Uncharacterized protein n=1 Tax=Methylomirabilis oxygeniifera TaxID=671143 RepID=D5MLY5_METO1|nr:protein of unknown function [Candidatus Methylomirabilis oxyfera]
MPAFCRCERPAGARQSNGFVSLVLKNGEIASPSARNDARDKGFGVRTDNELEVGGANVA